MFAKVKKLNLKQYQRMIVTSDIHGDYDGFIELLNEINFNEKDCMIIVGDILEKGKDSLKLLRKVMKTSNIYLVLGNNDTLFSDLKSGMVKPSDMIWYLNSREHSIFIEMANELNVEYQTEKDILKLEEKIFEIYQEEIKYLENCPHIIDSDLGIFVHAGIDPYKNLDKQDIDTCLSAPAFSNTKYTFDKPVIVGHWPASNYCTSIINVNIYHNLENNIISIDGGNSMKSWQQINYILFENSKMSFHALDRCEKIKCLDKQEESKDPISLIFPNTELIIKEKYDEKCNCTIPFLNKDMIIKNNHIYEYKRKTYCYDFTTYYLDIDKNEIVSYCEIDDQGILIKRNGIVGLYNGRYEKM